MNIFSSKNHFPFWAGFLVIFLAGFPSCANFRTYTETEKVEHLEKGEILSYLKKIEGTKLSIGEAQAIIEAPPARVWNMVTDYNRQDEFAPRTKEIEITKIMGNVVWVYMVLDAPWPLEDAKFTLKVLHDKEELRTNWNLVEGNIQESYGSWDLDPVPGKPNQTLAKYTLLYDDGRPIPKWIVNTFTRMAVKEIMVLVRQHVQDPEYDKPIYQISILNPSSTSLQFSHGPKKSGEKPRLDEETQAILR